VPFEDDDRAQPGGEHLLANSSNVLPLRSRIGPATTFAERLEASGGDEVTHAYALAFGREPSPEETEMAREFIGKEGLFAFCRTLFNANEFVYVD